MALKVKATHPNYSNGTEIAFGDFFLAKVGEEVVVTDENIDRYKRATGKDLKDSLPKNWTSTQATKADVDAVTVPEVEVVSEDSSTNKVEGGETA